MPSASYICSCCGKEHAGQPFSFAADFPLPYANLSRDERNARALISSDQCVIDGEQFYIRGCLEVPIQESDEIFLWGLWSKVKEEVFDEITDHWETKGRETMIGPYNGLLSNSLSIYPETLNLHLEIRIGPLGQRPRFVIEDADHVLAVEQQHGMSLEKAREYSCLLLRMVGQ